jgi:1-deoxy-D-xylulose-5-phosphate synthase
MLDRGGLTADDGPTHHGTFDLAYQRIFPNMVVMAPADASDVGAMLDFALTHSSPCSIRYPKTNAVDINRKLTPVELGKSETFREGRDGTIIACGTVLAECLKAAETLSLEGINVAVISARFVKPMDRDMVYRAIEGTPFVLTVEEAHLMGGFGSAFLETANDMRLPTQNVYRIGIPDIFVEHQSRPEALAELKLDAAGIAETCRQAARNSSHSRKDDEAFARKG